MSDSDRIREVFANRIEQKIRRERSIPSLLEAFERHPLTKIVVGVAFFLTLLATCMAVWGTSKQLRDLKSEQEARYWQLLSTKAAGNSGKVEALEWLFEHGTELVGLDLSCQALGGLDERGECKNRTYLKGLTLERTLDTGATLQGSFSGADLRNCQIRDVAVGLEINEALLSDCQFINIQGKFFGSAAVWDPVLWGVTSFFQTSGFTIRSSLISWEDPGDIWHSQIIDSIAIFNGVTSLRNVDLSESRVTIPFGTQIDGVNLSGTELIVLGGPEADKASQMQVWPYIFSSSEEASPVISTRSGNYFFENKPPIADGIPLGQVAEALGGKLFECPVLPTGFRVFVDLADDLSIRADPNQTQDEELAVKGSPPPCSLVDPSDKRLTPISEMMKSIRKQ